MGFRTEHEIIRKGGPGSGRKPSQQEKLRAAQESNALRAREFTRNESMRSELRDRASSLLGYTREHPESSAEVNGHFENATDHLDQGIKLINRGHTDEAVGHHDAAEQSLAQLRTYNSNQGTSKVAGSQHPHPSEMQPREHGKWRAHINRNEPLAIQSQVEKGGPGSGRRPGYGDEEKAKQVERWQSKWLFGRQR